MQDFHVDQDVWYNGRRFLTYEFIMVAGAVHADIFEYTDKTADELIDSNWMPESHVVPLSALSAVAP